MKLKVEGFGQRGAKSMLRRCLILLWSLVGLITLPAAAGTFGKVVAIGGAASDLALDEGRGVLYIANFTANRIEVMPLSTVPSRRRSMLPLSLAPLRCRRTAAGCWSRILATTPHQPLQQMH